MATLPSSFLIRPTFAPSVDKGKYTCVKCKEMLRPPVRQTACGHRICLVCVVEIRQSGNTMCPGQDSEEEECVDLSIEENVAPDFDTERGIMKLPVLCVNAEYGCKEIINLNKLGKHVERCPFRPVPCPNADCNVKGSKAFIEEHLKTCEFTRRRCDICRAEIPVKLLPGNAKALREHYQKPEEMAEHINMLTDRLRKVELERSEIIAELQAAKEAYGQGGSNADTAKVQHTLKKNQAKINEKCLLPEPDFDEACEVADLQTTKLYNHSLDRGNDRNGNSGIEEIANTGSSDEERSMIQSTVGMHDIRLAEYDLRFQCLESAGYEGVLIWKIKDYTRRKNDAISGRTLSLYSQPFYSSTFGYKMCARAYLNGDGMGKGTHLSLFFVIMKGDYDALLPWPFRQKVSLTLLDLEGGRKPLTDAFRPDPTSTSFRYPVGDMNIASGCPLFVAQSTVETRTYMKDDTIFIKVSIDTSDINGPSTYFEVTK